MPAFSFIWRELAVCARCEKPRGWFTIDFHLDL